MEAGRIIEKLIVNDIAPKKYVIQVHYIYMIICYNHYAYHNILGYGYLYYIKEMIYSMKKNLSFHIKSLCL